MSGPGAGTEVLVVGGGPVGLVAALALAGQGVEVTVVEAGRPEAGSEWRGSTIHPPTLELLDTLGLAGPVISGGVRVDWLQYRDMELDEVAAFDYSLLAGDTRFPFRLQFEQYKLLGRLRDEARSHPGIDMRFGTKLVSLTPADDRVDVELEEGGRRHHLSAGWLVGADGSHSAVRKALGVGFEGTSAADHSVVVATGLDIAACVPGLSPVSYWTGPRGRASFIRTPDVWRVALTADEALLAAAGRDGTDASPGGTDASPEGQQAVIAERIGTVTGDRPFELRQYQVYRNHYRVAGAFRAGRVLLAGDAAHITSTMGGMGLNSGVHDAFDLAARLGSVLRSGAPDTEMHRYAEIRRRVAVEVTVPVTRAAGAGAERRHDQDRRQRLSELCRTAADPVTARSYLRRASMIESARLHPVQPVGARS